MCFRLDSVEGFRAALDTETEQRVLRLRADGLPQVNALLVVDAAGNLVNFSRNWPVPHMRLNDRDYFQYFTTHDSGSFVSAAVPNRTNGKTTFFLVRRVNSPSGEFLGLVLAAIEIDYLRAFYQAAERRCGLHHHPVARGRFGADALPSRCIGGEGATALLGGADGLPAAGDGCSVVAQCAVRLAADGGDCGDQHGGDGALPGAAAAGAAAAGAADGAVGTVARGANRGADGKPGSTGEAVRGAGGDARAHGPGAS